MTKFKILFPYIFGLVSLIISFGLVSQARLAEVEPLPSPLPSATPLPKPELFPGAAKLARCRVLSQPRFFFYLYTTPHEVGKPLTISGTVYASDLTPLPDALVEVWQNNINQVNQPYFPTVLNVQLHTDREGHYEFKTMGPTGSEQSYLHYQVTYQNYCPLLMHLHLLVEPPARPAKPVYAQVEVTGPVLHGPVDIIMPVPPPRP
jgi:hypothetical protein